MCAFSWQTRWRYAGEEELLSLLRYFLPLNEFSNASTYWTFEATQKKGLCGHKVKWQEAASPIVALKCSLSQSESTRALKWRRAGCQSTATLFLSTGEQVVTFCSKKRGGISLKWLQRQQLFSTFKSSQVAVWTAIYPFLPLHWSLQAAVLEWEVGLQRKAQVASCRSACAIVDLRRKFYAPKKEKIGKHLIS